MDAEAPNARDEPARRSTTATATPRLSREASRDRVRVLLERARAALGTSRERLTRSRAWRGVLEPTSDAPDGALDPTAILAADVETRDGVAAFTRRLKAEGFPCERVLVQLKEAAAESTPANLSAIESRQLMEQVVRWSVEAYYDDATPEESPGDRR